MMLFAESEPPANPCISFHGRPLVFSVQVCPPSSDRQMPLSVAANTVWPLLVQSKWNPIIRPSGPLQAVHVAPASRDKKHRALPVPTSMTLGSRGLIAISPQGDSLRLPTGANVLPRSRLTR